MKSFLQRFGSLVLGVLSGFDRLVFRGKLCPLYAPEGMNSYLAANKVLRKDFDKHAHEVTQKVLQASLIEHAKATDRFAYLPSTNIDKDQVARSYAVKHKVSQGLVCVLQCVEPCWSFTLESPNHVLTVQGKQRKCSHLYHYFIDPLVGWMYVRLQTWFPFEMQVYVNGREWLAQQLRRHGSRFTQVDNCVFDIEDLGLAQRLLRQLDTRPWARVLRVFATRVNPLLRGHQLRPYYWSLDESEYATDVLFRDRASLQTVYPTLVAHAFQHFHTPDVLRFFGRPCTARTVEVTTRVQRRLEGVRVKHWVAENSLKMYDKLGQVLRVETTLNQPRRFKVYRATAPGTARHWVHLRKGIADISRRVVLSQATNARYLDALSVVALPTPVAQLLDPVSRRRIVNGRPYRPLRPITVEESRCFARMLDGRALLDGVRARDPREGLSAPPPTDPADHRRLTARVSRLLRLYRAHNLIAKVARTRVYRVTPKGQQVMTAALACRAATLEHLAA